MPFLAAALLAVTVSPPSAGLAAWERELARRWSEHSAEIAQTGREFRGTISGASLDELARLGFVFREAGVRRWNRRRFHPNDREFATRAALAQSAGDFERNLAAIVGYLRLSLALEAVAEDRRKRPRRAAHPGRDFLLEVAGEVGALRSRQMEAVGEGRLDPAYALTRESVGRLADPALYAEVRRAGREEVRAYWRRELLSLLWLLPALLASGLGAALFIRRQARCGFPRLGLAGQVSRP
jgi:hypothetical protein